MKKGREAQLCKRRETDRVQRARDRKNMERDHEREVRSEGDKRYGDCRAKRRKVEDYA